MKSFGMFDVELREALARVYAWSEVPWDAVDRSLEEFPGRVREGCGI